MVHFAPIRDYFVGESYYYRELFSNCYRQGCGLNILSEAWWTCMFLGWRSSCRCFFPECYFRLVRFKFLMHFKTTRTIFLRRLGNQVTVKEEKERKQNSASEACKDTKTTHQAKCQPRKAPLS